MNSGKPIMLVEDDLVDVKTVKRAFKEAKILNHLAIAHNGEEALKILRDEKSFEEDTGHSKPCMILLDLNMPVMNGIEFLKIIKDDPKYKTIPVIVLTTSREENDRVESYNFGVAGYIIKPVEFEKFVEAAKIIDLYWTLSEFPYMDK